MISPPEYLGLDVFLAIFFGLSLMPPLTGVRLRSTASLNELISPFSPFNLQVMKLAFPTCFGFVLGVSLLIDPRVPKLLAVGLVVVVVAAVGGVSFVGLSRGNRPLKKPVIEDDRLEYSDRIRQMEDGIIADEHRSKATEPAANPHPPKRGHSHRH